MKGMFTPRSCCWDRQASCWIQPEQELTAALERLRQDKRIELDQIPTGGPANQAEGAKKQVRETGSEYTEPAVYLAPFYFSERSVAQRLATLHYTLPSRLSDLPPAFLPTDTQLSAEQQSAVHKVLSHPVSILTGGLGPARRQPLKLNRLAGAGSQAICPGCPPAELRNGCRGHRSSASTSTGCWAIRR
jgi:hypothetical protein